MKFPLKKKNTTTSNNYSSMTIEQGFNWQIQSTLIGCKLYSRDS